LAKHRSDAYILCYYWRGGTTAKDLAVIE